MPGFLSPRPAWPDRLNLPTVNILEPDRLPPSLLPENFLRWFASRGWSPREHQLALLEKARDGRSALLIAPTGAGKTLAGFLPTLVELSAIARGWGVAPRVRMSLLTPRLLKRPPPPTPPHHALCARGEGRRRRLQLGRREAA